MNDIERIILTAEKEVGYKEEPMGKHLTKYGIEYGWNGVAWCVIFIWWLFKKCYLSSLFFDGGKTASCGAVYRWAVKKGIVVKTPKRGDLVIFTFRKDKNGNPETSHIGLLVDCNSKYVTTIDGNTCVNGSPDNGGHVMKQTRSRKYVYAFIRPLYNESEIIEFEYTVVRGDSLYRIAEKFYGENKGYLWKKIYEYNGLTSTIIHPGQKLKLPSLVD